ncbi:hypothetical protein KPH14_007431 [Odynerus spinipes]|uniref:Nudix hydrolase domain-containing protein n=1 Tax=Odynerus spinipes TaxID=1348599 RepID=A0AAD9RBQ5_9HYME|nr:hypothetical protein KPH14_007431 [Odynerus spinipes]
MKAWRESATLILAARHGQKYNRALPSVVFQYNYKLLCLKRHQNSSFMPKLYVFPGGVTHPADADLKWHQLFNTFGFDNNSFRSLFSNTGLRPQIFQSKSDELPKEISLRITAIRETFEECGILLCKQIKKNGILSHWAQSVPISKEEVQDWQHKVHDDATEFYTMCEKLKCYPDLWSLHEWSNWLTPTYYTRRYDTIFYLACMPHVPYSNYETSEMEGMEWDTPQNFCQNTDITMAPPQHYEISRIAKFECLDNLLNFAVERSKRGVQLCLPVKVMLQDGQVHVLPGDSMYPENPSLTEKQIIDKTNMTIAEFQAISPTKNRIAFYGLEVKKVIVHNLDSVEGHLTPMSSKTVNIKCVWTPYLPPCCNTLSFGIFVTAHVNIQDVKRNINKPFSTEPSNLTNLSSYRYSGLVHRKSVGIVDTPDKKGFAVVYKKANKVHKPAKATVRSTMKSGARRSLYKLRRLLKTNKYRVDLTKVALRRASAVLRSQKPLPAKKTRAPKKAD